MFFILNIVVSSLNSEVLECVSGGHYLSAQHQALKFRGNVQGVGVLYCLMTPGLNNIHFYACKSPDQTSGHK